MQLIPFRYYNLSKQHLITILVAKECVQFCDQHGILIAGANYYFYAWELPIFVLMGCLGGLSGALWIKCNIALTKLRAKYVPARLIKKRLLEVRPTN